MTANHIAKFYFWKCDCNLWGWDAPDSGHEGADPDCGGADGGGEQLRSVHVHQREAGRGKELAEHCQHSPNKVELASTHELCKKEEFTECFNSLFQFINISF